ncbi:hypothetical protein, partial [Actinoplanes xinjiangensis]|uniref:hypothetical protein n=1 Tax=Actinoplanes xinjiangensis TaxID=512350 RepID=UPI001941FC6E
MLRLLGSPKVEYIGMRQLSGTDTVWLVVADADLRAAVRSREYKSATAGTLSVGEPRSARFF